MKFRYKNHMMVVEITQLTDRYCVCIVTYIEWCCKEKHRQGVEHSRIKTLNQQSRSIGNTCDEEYHNSDIVRCCFIHKRREIVVSRCKLKGLDDIDTQRFAGDLKFYQGIGAYWII